jgi:hypothetical protein
MKAKQGTEPATCVKLRALIDQFEQSYRGAHAGHAH